MSTRLQLFEFQAKKVRIVTKDGVAWFVLADLCAALDISNSRNVAARLHEADVRQTGIRSGGQMRFFTIVNESGMWDVVLDSSKPAAKAFRRWVTRDVLPAIRETGSYSVAPVPALTGTELLAAAVIEAQAIIAAKEQTIQELAPKTQSYDDLFIGAENDYDPQRCCWLPE